MKVFLLKDVEKVGIAGEIINVSDGYAANFLFPRKLAVVVTAENESSFANRIKVVEKRNEVIATKTSMLAEKIRSLDLILKKKLHDNNKLYGAISAHEIVDLLAQKGVSISKSQVEFDKSIKSQGVHEVVIKLSSQLRPTVKVKIVGE
ncbi:MAG: 50S ribosomal protein L9 [Candidatus Babeliaceae bacterium]|jgi:large subunit ribosomal protein L9